MNKNDERKWNVAVVGALGMVGTEMIRTLERRCFPVKELRLLDIATYVGTDIEFAGGRVKTQEAKAENFEGVDIAIFSAGAEPSLELAPQAVRKGAVVVDNSSAWRMDPQCPLVVPEVNPQDLRWHKGIIANPNCSTIQMVVALHPIHKKARIKRIVVSTYQATSGAGLMATSGLTNQTKEFMEKGTITDPDPFQYQIAFNIIPQIDVFQEGDYTKEENKMIKETQKIMGDDSIEVTATCVRIPVFFGHSESVNIETEEKISPDEVRKLLEDAPGVTVIDDPDNLKYPMPLPTEHTDDVYVGRIREDFTIDNGINLWIVSDNIRKGAALNTVQIAEELIKIGLGRAE